MICFFFLFSLFELINSPSPHNSNLKPLILALGDCVPVRLWPDSPIACLAELRMIWRDKIEQCLLVGLRLYFLPENTPNGRNCHGEVSFIYRIFQDPEICNPPE